MAIPTVHANGADIPAIGFGTWDLRSDAGRDAIVFALKSGYRHIDTAAVYENEVQVGAAMRASGVPRDAIFLTTKVWIPDCRSGRLVPAAEESLRRLGVDQVDLLLIHWPNDQVSVADQIGALCEAKRAGLTRHIGVSNFPSAMLREAVAVADAPLVTNQVEYHPFLDQSAVLTACRETGMSLTAFSPIGQGRNLSNPVIKDVAAETGKTAAQVVLRWHIQQPGVIAIPRSGNPGRIAENLAIDDFALTAEQMTRITALARPDGRINNPSFAPDWDR